MMYSIVYYTYYISLLFACACGIQRFNKIDNASRIISILLCCAFLNEGAAYFLAKWQHNNLALHNIYCFIEFGLLSLYFNYIIDVFAKRNIGIYIGVAGVLISFFNAFYIQDVNVLNSYFLFFEGLAVIGMSFFAFFRLLVKNDGLNLFKYPHFWFLTILVFFWCITFMSWGLYDYINLKFQNTVFNINTILLAIGVITYTSLGIVFILYHKMQKKQ